MKQYLLIIFCSCLLGNLAAQEALNMSLFGQVNRGDDRYSGSWSYVDAINNREYALLGTTSGTAVYDITMASIEEVGFIAGPYSRWREITVIGQYAYVVTEGSGVGEGMQVLDLSNLPNEVSLLTTYTNTFTRGHIIQRDLYSETPYVYVNGTCNSCGVNIIEVSNPENPIEVGNYNPGYYVHDCHVKGDYLYAAAFYKGMIDIVNIADKANPILEAQIEVPAGNTHSSWLTEDNQHLIISAESDGLPARIWNIADLENVYEVATYISNSQSLTHNPYVRGDFVFFSHNTEGIRVVDIKDPSCPVEVGYYDTFDGSSGGFNGLWSACPYFPSGKIIGGNREDGLYVWTFNNKPANRFSIRVNDAATGLSIEGATVQFEEETENTADESGIFKYGTLNEQVIIKVRAAGFESKDTMLSVSQGTQLTLNLSLQSSSVSIKEPSVLPTALVYPNPFSISTTIDLSAFPNAQRLVINDVLGRRIHTFSITNQHPFQLNSDNLLEGVYYYLVYDELGMPLAKGNIRVE